MIGGCPLIAGDDCRQILDRSTAIDEGPPVEGFGCTPGIHVGTDADQNFRSTQGQLAAIFAVVDFSESKVVPFDEITRVLGAEGPMKIHYLGMRAPGI